MIAADLSQYQEVPSIAPTLCQLITVAVKENLSRRNAIRKAEVPSRPATVKTLIPTPEKIRRTHSIQVFIDALLVFVAAMQEAAIPAEADPLRPH